MQSTNSGFGYINSENVFKVFLDTFYFLSFSNASVKCIGDKVPPVLLLQVCDEPHPLLVKSMLEHCVNADINEAYKVPLNICPRKYSELVKK